MTDQATQPIPTMNAQLISRYSSTAAVAGSPDAPPERNATIIATSTTPKPPGRNATDDAVIPATYATSSRTIGVAAIGPTA